MFLMSEDFIHYLWHQRLFYPSGLTLFGSDETVEVLHPGWPNHHAGPDFFNSRIKIGSTLWAGNVEIHLKSSEWYQHGHQTDAAYNNVILHVVVHADADEVFDSTGRAVPQMILRYPDDLYAQYDSLIHNTNVIKCIGQIANVSSLDYHSWLDRMLYERMEQRSLQVKAFLDEFEGNWDQVFFVMLCRAMGFGVNGDPFEMLARGLPAKLLFRHSNDLLQLEALLFGQAGFLENADPSESYVSLLMREYRLLRHKYNLKPMAASNWKFMRLRPPNFPTIRLSQLASIIFKNPGNFESWVNIEKASLFFDHLDVEGSGYWKTHYRFGVVSSHSLPAKLGVTSRNLLIVNAFIPFMFAKSQMRGNTEIQDDILKLFCHLSVEKNSVLNEWAKGGIVPANEGEAQALIYLRQNYCLPGKCLHCRIGHIIISGSSNKKMKPTDKL